MQPCSSCCSLPRLCIPRTTERMEDLFQTPPSAFPIQFFQTSSLFQVPLRPGALVTRVMRCPWGKHSASCCGSRDAGLLCCSSSLAAERGSSRAEFCQRRLIAEKGQAGEPSVAPALGTARPLLGARRSHRPCLEGSLLQLCCLLGSNVYILWLPGPHSKCLLHPKWCPVPTGSVAPATGALAQDGAEPELSGVQWMPTEVLLPCVAGGVLGDTVGRFSPAQTHIRQWSRQQPPAPAPLRISSCAAQTPPVPPEWP